MPSITLPGSEGLELPKEDITSTLVESEVLAPTQDQPDLPELEPSTIQPIGPGLETNKTKDTSFAATIGASALYTTTAIGKYFNQIESNDTSFDSNYDYKAGIVGTPYEQHINDFATTTSESQKAAMKRQIDLENIYKEDISNAGVVPALAAGMISQVADPTMLIPGMVFLKGYRLVGSALKTAASAAALTGGAVGLQEAILHNQQITRTTEESMYNMAASTILGGLVGGVMGARIHGRVHSTLKSILKAEELNVPDVPNTGSAGAAQVQNFQKASDSELKSFAPEWMQNISPKAAKVYNEVVYATSHIPFIESPMMKGLRSELDSTRRIMSSIFDNPLEQKMHGERAATPAWENKTWQDEAALGDWHLQLENAWAKSNDWNVKNGKKRQSYGEWNEEITYYYNRPHEAPSNPHMADIIQQQRSEIKRLNKEMIKWGRLTEDQAKMMESGDLSRVWNRTLIQKYRKELHDILTDHYMTKAEGSMTKDEARAYSSEAIDNILSLKEDSSSLVRMTQIDDDKGVRWTKDRTIDIPNYKVEKFISKDFHGVTLQYKRQAMQLQRYYEMMNSHGAQSPKDLLKQLEFEYDTRIAGMTDDKQIVKLGKQLAKDKELIMDSIRVMLGQYMAKHPSDRFFRMLKNYNFSRLMGMMVAGMLPDVAAPILKNGLKTTISGWINSARSLAGPLSKMAKKDLQILNVTLDLHSNSALRNMLEADYANELARGAEKVTDVMSDAMMKYSGGLHFNVVGKTISAHAANSRLINDLISIKKNGWESLTDAERSFLNHHFIDKNDVDSILSQWKKHGAEKDGVAILNLDEWDNVAIRDKVINYGMKMVNETIIRAGRGDIPLLFQSYQFMSTLFQFKSFFAGASNRVYLPIHQRRDAKIAQGLTALLSMGALTYIVRSYWSGKEPELTPDRLIMEGINRSGVLGLISDPLFALVLNDFMVPSRLAQQNKVEYLFGPSISAYTTAWKLYGRLIDSKHKMDKKDLDLFIKLLPFQNLHIIDQILRQTDIRGTNKK